MSKKNNKDVKMIKVRVVYDNFINKYTKTKYPLGEMEVTEKRLAEILKVEKESGVKLIEVIDENATNGDEENGEDTTNVQTPEVGANEENGANAEDNKDGEVDGENGEENGDSDNADDEDNKDGEETNDAE